MEKKIEKLLDDKLTLAEFLNDDEKELELEEIIVDTEKDNVTVKYGTDKEDFKANIEFAEQKADAGQNLTDVLIDLKKDWSKLLEDKHYFGDLDQFMNKYKLTKISINLVEEEVRFESGKYHLVEGLDLLNQ